VTFPFPSVEWVAAYGAAINASETYRTASLNWTFGAVALVVAAQPELGLAEPAAILLDLDRGTCRAARLVPAGEAQSAPFILTAQYDRWKQIIRKEVGPIAAILQRKLSLQGSLPIVVRFVKSAEALVEVAAAVPTRFLDERAS